MLDQDQVDWVYDTLTSDSTVAFFAPARLFALRLGSLEELATVKGRDRDYDLTDPEGCAALVFADLHETMVRSPWLFDEFFAESEVFIFDIPEDFDLPRERVLEI